MTAMLTEILQLSVSERIQLVEDIWDSISAVPENLTLNDAQKKELDRRLAAHQNHPEQTTPWEEVKQRIRDAK